MIEDGCPLFDRPTIASTDFRLRALNVSPVLRLRFQRETDSPCFAVDHRAIQCGFRVVAHGLSRVMNDLLQLLRALNQRVYPIATHPETACSSGHVSAHRNESSFNLLRCDSRFASLHFFTHQLCQKRKIILACFWPNVLECGTNSSRKSTATASKPRWHSFCFCTWPCHHLPAV